MKTRNQRGTWIKHNVWTIWILIQTNNFFLIHKIWNKNSDHTWWFKGTIVKVYRCDYGVAVLFCKRESLERGTQWNRYRCTDVPYVWDFLPDNLRRREECWGGYSCNMIGHILIIDGHIRFIILIIPLYMYLNFSSIKSPVKAACFLWCLMSPWWTGKQDRQMLFQVRQCR